MERYRYTSPDAGPNASPRTGAGANASAYTDPGSLTGAATAGDGGGGQGRTGHGLRWVGRGCAGVGNAGLDMVGLGCTGQGKVGLGLWGRGPDEPLEGRHHDCLLRGGVELGIGIRFSVMVRVMWSHVHHFNAWSLGIGVRTINTIGRRSGLSWD